MVPCPGSEGTPGHICWLAAVLRVGPLQRHKHQQAAHAGSVMLVLHQVMLVLHQVNAALRRSQGVRKASRGLFGAADFLPCSPEQLQSSRESHPPPAAE